MKRAIAFLLIALFMIQTIPVNASMFDLSRLSNTDIVSHNHIWSKQYDATSHWEVCDICKQESEKISHSLSRKYSISETSCSPSNKIITSCSTCAYAKDTAHQNKHTPKSITHAFHGDTQYLKTDCVVCGSPYHITDLGGAVYT